MKRFICVLCVLALLLTVPVSAAPARLGEVYTLPVFETSDIHGFLVDSSAGEEAQYQYRLAYIANKVEAARQGDADNTVLLDGGDIYQGNVVSNLQDGAPMVAAFDTMRYDAVALGNHEFDWGVTNTTDPDGTMPAYTLGDLSGDSQIPVLCSNLYYAGTSNRVNFTQDYVILDKTARTAGGAELSVKIAVIGYADNYSSSIMSAEIDPYTIRTGLSTVETLASSLKSSKQADAVILLTHAGASSIASGLKSGSAIDLVCGGHTHTPQSGSGSVSYIQAGAQATSYASAQLNFDTAKAVSVDAEATHSVTDSYTDLYDTPANADKLSEDVLSLSHMALAGVTEALNTPLGYVTVSITKDNIDSMSSTAGNWMTDLANRATGSKVSFTNNGGIRTNLYVNGSSRTVTAGDVYTIAPFDNLLYVYDVTYAELLSILKWAIGSGRGLSLRMSGIDCYYSGSQVTALVEDGVCLYQDGVWASGQANKTVRISTNEFIATSDGTPFYNLNGTSALVSNTQVDNESFINVLRAEGVDGTGKLYVDTKPHLIDGSYTGACSNGHSWDEGKLTTPATCTQTGSITYTCTVCGAAQTEAVAKTAHTYTVTTVAPTISAGGYDLFTCSVCGYYYKNNFRPPLTDPCAGGHSWDAGKLTTPATCTQEGSLTYTCTVCGSTKTEAVAKTAHSYTVTTVTPTLTAGGYDLFTCSVCGYAYQGNLTPALNDPCAAFTDMDRSAWYHTAVDYVLTSKLMFGTGDDTFSPTDKLSRAMLVTMLYRLEEEPTVSGEAPFTDLTAEWYRKAAIWGSQNGILSGTGNGLFSPNRNITREEIAVILYHYAAYKGLDTSAQTALTAFPDADSVMPFAESGMSWAVASGYLSGALSGGVISLNPLGEATRAEAAALLMRFMQG